MTRPFSLFIAVMFLLWFFWVADKLGQRDVITKFLFPKPSAANAQPTNPVTDTKLDEGGKDAPAPGEKAEPEEEPLISSTAKGTGEEFDGTRSLKRRLTWLEEGLAHAMRKLALDNGWHYAPLEDAEKIGDHLMVVVIKGKGAGEFAGFYYRDTPLEEWEKKIARGLLNRAKEGGSEEEK